jgi:hypothetical protein
MSTSNEVNVTAQVALAFGLSCLAVGGVLAQPVSGTSITHVQSVSDPMPVANPLETTSSFSPELAIFVVGTALLVGALLIQND